MKSLAKDTAIYGVSSILGKFLNYLLVPLYTYVLKQTSDYGIVTNLYAWTALLLVLLTYFIDMPLQHNTRVIDQRDLLADGLDALHVVGREQHGAALLLQAQDFDLELVGVDRVKARERLVKDEQAWLVDYRGDELHLLLHAFAQRLELLVAPLAQVKAFEPLLHLVVGGGLVHALEAGEVDDLFAHFHLLV